MQPFVVNRHGRLVFPSNFFPELDFSVIESSSSSTAVIRRDFEDEGADRYRHRSAGSRPARTPTATS